jgi:hypothetical protein
MLTFFFGGIHLLHLQLKQKKYKGNSNQASFWGVGYVVFNAMQSVPITANVVSSNLAHGEVYSIQHYLVKFVSDLQQVSGLLYQC